MSWISFFTGFIKAAKRAGFGLDYVRAVVMEVRNMLIGRLRDHLASHNWFAVLIDVFVVVISILVAFQIDRWAELNRNQELELEYLLRLKKDLRMEMERMESALEYANDRIEAVRFLERALNDSPGSIETTNSLPWAIETATWRSFPQITAFVYTELQSTGNLSLIRSDVLRESLADHYQVLQHEARVGLDLEAQRQFTNQTAGILTIDELVAVENGSWGGGPASVSPARAREIVAALRERGSATAWLPNLVQHHTFNTKVIARALQRAQALIDQIDAVTSETG